MSHQPRFQPQASSFSGSHCHNQNQKCLANSSSCPTALLPPAVALPPEKESRRRRFATVRAAFFLLLPPLFWGGYRLHFSAMMPFQPRLAFTGTVRGHACWLPATPPTCHVISRVFLQACRRRPTTTWLATPSRPSPHVMLSDYHFPRLSFSSVAGTEGAATCFLHFHRLLACHTLHK